MIKHKANEIELSAYSDLRQYEKDEKEQPFHILIAGEEQKSVLRGSEVINIYEEKNILFLCEETNEEEIGGEENTKIRHKSILKYQPIEQILHEMYFLLGKEKGADSLAMYSRKLQIIGVCSPIQHEMQTFFSVLYAMNQTQEKKVLYLNFLEIWGFKQIFKQQGKYDLGDLLLAIRSERLNSEKYWSCVYEMHGMSVVLPFENPQNIHFVSEKEFQILISFVEKNTDFELLVIDFGFGMEEMAACMNVCNTVFLLGREGFFYECQQQTFLEWLKQRGGEEIEQKVQQIYLPYTAKNIKWGEHVVEQLQWSEFGDFVRRCM